MRLKRYSEGKPTPRTPVVSSDESESPPSRRRLKTLKETRESTTPALKRKAVEVVTERRSSRKRPPSPQYSSESASSDIEDFIANSSEEESDQGADFYNSIGLLMDERDNLAITIAPSHSFSSYIEFLILLLTTSPEKSAGTIKTYSASIRRTEEEIQTRSEAAMSTLWSNLGGFFKASLDSFPVAYYQPRDFNYQTGRCAACFHQGWSAILVLGGAPYDSQALWKSEPREFFRATQLKNLEGGKEPKVTENDEYFSELREYLNDSEWSQDGGLTVHETCGVKALKYHGIFHWKLKTMKKVYEYLKSFNCESGEFGISYFRDDAISQARFFEDFENAVQINEKYLQKCEAISRSKIE